MEKAIVISLVVLGLFNLVLMAMIYDLMVKVNEQSRKLSTSFKSHEDWLFNQLYTMAPGKVLRPDEVEEMLVKQPAKVYNPSKDPMREFKDGLNDWF